MKKEQSTEFNRIGAVYCHGLLSWRRRNDKIKVEKSVTIICCLKREQTKQSKWAFCKVNHCTLWENLSWRLKWTEHEIFTPTGLRTTLPSSPSIVPQLQVLFFPKEGLNNDFHMMRVMIQRGTWNTDKDIKNRSASYISIFALWLCDQNELRSKMPLQKHSISTVF